MNFSSTFAEEMKKYLISILAFLYLSLSTGVVINLHYCMGDLASVELGVSHDDTCAKCGMKDQKGCCETEYQLVKVQDVHQAAKDFSGSILNTPALTPVPVSTTWVPVFVSTPAENSTAHPPDIISPDRCVMHCLFRI